LRNREAGTRPAGRGPTVPVETSVAGARIGAGVYVLIYYRTARHVDRPRPLQAAHACTRHSRRVSAAVRRRRAPAGNRGSAPALHQRPSPRPASYVLLPSSAGPVPRTQGPTPRFGLVNPRRLKLPVDLFNDL